MKDIARIAVAALAFAGALTLGTDAAVAGDQHREWNACTAEDGSGQKRCIWHGKRMGNGIGNSVKIFNGGEDDMRVKVITHRFASHLLDRH